VKRILYLFLLLPLGVVLIVLSVINRQPVTLRLDPFSDVDPALSLTLPFFAWLFAAILVGAVIGAIATWFGQGRHRRIAKREHTEAHKWQSEAESQRKRADELAANLAASQSAGATLAVPSPSQSGGDHDKAA